MKFSPGAALARAGRVWLEAGLRWLLVVPPAVATAVVYHELRPVPPADEVAAVFE